MIKKENIVLILTICYFSIAFFEVIAEYFVNRSFIFILKPLITSFLILIYYIESEQKSKLFITALLLSLMTNILFIPNTPIFLFYALIIFTIHRIICIYLIIKLQKIKDVFPSIIATVPFLLIFFYLFVETQDIPVNSFILLIIQNILISVFAGISLASYVMNDTKQNSILLISTLLFVMLNFAVFVEKYFLINEYQELFRPLAMTLNALAFFSFYKYVITVEKN